MVSVITHAAFAMALGSLLPRRLLPWRALVLGGMAAMLPDGDYFLLQADIGQTHGFAHRGATHSLTMAAAVGLLAAVAVAATTRRDAPRPWPGPRWLLAVYVAASMASHGLLDALTNGGAGIAFLWPWSAERWHAPWRPIEVAPLSVRGFFTSRGAEVFASELCWVWAPTAALLLAVAVWRRHARRSARKKTAAGACS